MIVKDVMTRNPVYVSPETTLTEAKALMTKKNINKLPVIDKNDRLAGIITKNDLAKAGPSDATTLDMYEIGYLLSKLTVEKIMTKKVVTVSENEIVEEAARIMVDNQIGCLPVMKDDILIGIVTESDLFHLFTNMFGARHEGVRVTISSADKPGQLAKIAEKIAALNGNIVSVVTDELKEPGVRRLTIKATDITLERMQSMGFCVTMMPAIKRLYSKKEDQAAALKRHLEFFNTQPWIGSAIMGVTAAMEEERANGAPIDDGAINGVKVGLMGPLAGVGDPIYWGTARIILAALGASLAVTGNIMGPLIFFIGINIIRILTRWYSMKYGYEKGTEIVQDMEGGQLQKLTTGASVLGLFVMGGLVARWASLNIPLEIARYTNQAGEEVVTTVQSVLNDLLPGLVPLLLTFLCMTLLKKKVSAIAIIFVMFAVGIAGRYLGVLGL